MKTCEQCTALFLPQKKRQRFCSVPCANQWTVAHRRSYAGAANPNHGRQHTPETRAKQRAAALGRVVSAETRAKQSARRRGVSKPRAWREAISAALRASDKVNNAGARNPNYKTGAYVDERIYRTLVDLTACEQCGTQEMGLDVHHKDGNHYNNDPANLQVLCDRCHGKRHGRPPGIRELKPRKRRNSAA